MFYNSKKQIIHCRRNHAHISVSQNNVTSYFLKNCFKYVILLVCTPTIIQFEKLTYLTFLA